MERGSCDGVCPKFCTKFVMKNTRSKRGNFCENCSCKEERHKLLNLNSAPLNTLAIQVNENVKFHWKSQPKTTQSKPTVHLIGNETKIQKPLIPSKAKIPVVPKSLKPTKAKVCKKQCKSNENPVPPAVPSESSSQRELTPFLDSASTVINSNGTIKESFRNSTDNPVSHTNTWLPQELTSGQNKSQQPPVAHCSKVLSPVDCFLKRPFHSSQGSYVNNTTLPPSELTTIDTDLLADFLQLQPPSKCIKVSHTDEDLLFTQSSFVQDLTSASPIQETHQADDTEADHTVEYYSQEIDVNILTDSQLSNSQVIPQSQPQSPIAPPQSAKENRKQKTTKAKDDLTKQTKAAIKNIVDEEYSTDNDNDPPLLTTMRVSMTNYCSTNDITGGAKKTHGKAPQIRHPLPLLSKSTLDVLTGGDDKEVILQYDAIIEEVAEYIAPLPITTNAQYAVFGSEMVGQYQSLGTVTLVNNYRKAKWEALGKPGEPDPEWPDREIDALKEAAKRDYEEAKNRGENPKKPGRGDRPCLIGENGEKVYVVKHPKGYSYFNRLLSSRVRHLRFSRRTENAVESVLATCGEGPWMNIEDLWPFRSKGLTDYTAAQAGLAVKMRAEMDKEECDHDFVTKAFAETFKLRTSLLGMAFGVQQMFEQYRILKSPTYIKLEAQLMLGRDKFANFRKNSSIFFAAVQKLKPNSPGWTTFMEAMRTVVLNPKEIKEISCGGDVLGGTAEKFPHLIVVKRPDNTIETVVIRVEGYVITGCQDWKEGVEVLLLCYLIMSFNIRKQSNVIQMLAWAFFGLRREKKLSNSAGKKMLATLQIL